VILKEEKICPQNGILNFQYSQSSGITLESGHLRRRKSDFPERGLDTSKGWKFIGEKIHKVYRWPWCNL